MFLSENLLDDIKIRSFAPISQTTFTDANLLDMATREMRSKIVPHIMQVREDFFQTTKSQTITASLARYTVPKDAIGNSVKGLYIQDSAGNKIPLNRTDSAKASAYSGKTGEPEKYYFEGDEVVLLPTPGSSGLTLLIEYYQKPSQLALTATCAKISSAATVSSTITYTVDTDLSSDLSVGDKVDFLSAQSPFLLWAKDASITAITSTTIAVAVADVQNAVGTAEPQTLDYICPTGTANIPMLPEEWHDVLGQSVAVRLLRALGDATRIQAEYAILKDMIQDAKLLIQSRSESQPEYISITNPLMRAFGGR